MRQIAVILFLFICSCLYCQDTNHLRVHFLYGSKPIKKYKDTEKKWFGGVMGGHVGVEGRNDRIVNFVPQGKFHVIPKRHDKHSTYAIHSNTEFYSIFGGNPDSVKRTVVFIPVTTQQWSRFDSVTTVYLRHTPYDYAFFGMRCGAATHDMLGKSGVLPDYSYSKVSRKIFYPKKLRKKLLKTASKNNWRVETRPGTMRRKWEKD